jgi:hypothetical protein
VYVIGALCAVALMSAGCSRKDPQLARVEGAEPQRLSFGRPQAVQAAFAQKMQACWFSGTYPLLGGYHYDAGTGLFRVSNGEAGTQQITIYSGRGEDARIFQVQFTPFNDNTLISTRSRAFPPELAARMKRDVETWIFGRNDCGGGPLPDVYAPPQQNGWRPLPDQTTPRLQHASLPEVESTGSTTMSRPETALSRARN